MKFTYQFLKKGMLYPIEKIPSTHVGICKFCSCPVVFHPEIQIIDSKMFKIIGYKLKDSRGNEHHCFKYKLG